MTEFEAEYEHYVETLTRLGLMCGSGDPTPEQCEIAKMIADEHVAACQNTTSKHE